MPIYVYECGCCGHSFEETQKADARPLVWCTKCDGETLQRVIQPLIGLIFRGSGFYCTDNRKPDRMTSKDKDYWRGRKVDLEKKNRLKEEKRRDLGLGKEE